MDNLLRLAFGLAWRQLGVKKHSLVRGFIPIRAPFEGGLVPKLPLHVTPGMPG